MNTYFALFLLATLTSLLFTPVVRRLCERFNLLDIPKDQRRLHITAVPRLGGVAVFSSVVVALSLLPFLDNLLTQRLSSQVPQLVLVLVPATLVLCLGIYDDLRGTNPTVKFIALGLIAALFFFMGGRIETLAIPFVGSVHLHVVVSFVLTIVWLVGIANAFNLIDGVDGLASGAALFASLVILLISLAGENPMMIVMSLVICGALVGFLRYNFNPASIFLGDSGALFVGFTLAALSVVGTQKATTAVAVIIPILAFGLPVVDTGVTMTRRLLSGHPVFQGDREHIHHMLLARGWSQRHVVLVLYSVCAMFGLTAAIFTRTSTPVTGLALFVIAVVVIVAVGHLRYHEVDELKAGMKRTVSGRRARLAKNIRIRRASLALSKASDLFEICESVKRMLEFGEFAYSNMQVGQTGRGEINQLAYEASQRRHESSALELRGGRIYWSWHREDIEAEDVIGSQNFWCVRLPLSTSNMDLGWMNLYRAFNSPPLMIDINYLSGLFQEELTQSLERILTSVKEVSVEQIRVSIDPEKQPG